MANTRTDSHGSVLDQEKYFSQFLSVQFVLTRKRLRGLKMRIPLCMPYTFSENTCLPPLFLALHYVEFMGD